MDSDASTDRKTAALHALARERYENRPDPPDPASPSLSWESLTRRTAVVGVLGSLGAVLFAGSATAAPSGTFPAAGDDPLLKIRADRMVLVPRTSDVPSPADGTLAYRSDK